MNEYEPADYTFLGLCQNGKPLASVRSLVYQVGLVDSVRNEICDLKVVNTLLPLIFTAEEQIDNPSFFLEWQEDTLPKGYHPQTPCMLTIGWSPISALLEQGFAPVLLSRNTGALANAVGIWRPVPFRSSKTIADSETFEQLFWAILTEAFRRAEDRNALVSIIAEPGWDYDTAVGSLPNWSEQDIARADRILWKRTPEG